MSALKPAVFIGSSRSDLRVFPTEVRRVMGVAIHDAQSGDEHPAAKALKGFGGRSVLEVVDDFDGDTYRSVYTVRFAGVVYVLHAFQKKAKTGIGTPKYLIDTNTRAFESRGGSLSHPFRGRRLMSENVTIGSGNVFADLDFDNPEEELLKAKLVREIRAILKQRNLSPADAAPILEVEPTDVSAILIGRTGNVSIDRLVGCLDRLDYDVDVVVRQKVRGAVATA